MVRELGRPLAELVEETRESLLAVVRPHAVGPIDADKAIGTIEGCTRNWLALAPHQIYAIREDAPPEVWDAVQALQELAVVTHNFNRQPPDLAMIFRRVFTIGALCERIKVRPFEKDVRQQRKRQKPLDEHNAERKHTAAALKADKYERASAALRKHPDAKSAAKSLGISPRTFYRWRQNE